MEEKILEQLASIKQYLMLSVKKVLTLKEAAIILGMKPETVRGLAQKNTIPSYKPNHNLLYFRKDELEQWMLQNRSATQAEIESQVEAINYSIQLTKQGD